MKQKIGYSEKNVLCLFIYDKSESDSISDDNISEGAGTHELVVHAAVHPVTELLPVCVEAEGRLWELW